jgi:hypothetical protein
MRFTYPINVSYQDDLNVKFYQPRTENHLNERPLFKDGNFQEVALTLGPTTEDLYFSLGQELCNNRVSTPHGVDDEGGTEQVKNQMLFMITRT